LTRFFIEHSLRLTYEEINLLKENEKALCFLNYQDGCTDTTAKNPSAISIADRLCKDSPGDRQKVVKQFDSDPNWIARA